MIKRKNPHAVALGRIGGKTTAKRGPEYYRKINKLRKNPSGGRPLNPGDKVKPGTLYQRARRARLKVGKPAKEPIKIQ